MNAVWEIFPILAGVVTGFVCAAIGRRAPRIVVGATSTVLCGVAAFYLSGEYVESWAFVLLDMVWVGGSAILVFLGRQLYLRRRSRG